MSILVTGGSGFIGKSLVLSLLKKKEKIYVLDNDFRGSMKKFSKLHKTSLVLIKGDIRNKKLVHKYVKKVHTVFHLAFINGTRYFYDQPRLVLDVGILGTLNVLEAVRNSQKTKTLIYASSSEVYNSPPKVPTDEMVTMIVPDTFNSRYSYSSSKLIGEIMCYNYLKDKKKKLIIFRPHNIFGENMGYEHVIPELVKKIFKASNGLKRKKISLIVQGTGNETRSFCYINEAIDQILYLYKNGKSNNIYNVGNSDEIKIKALLNLIAEIVDIKLKIKPGKIRKGSTLRRCPDLKKINNLGYITPNKIYKTGLKSTVEWYINDYKKTLNL